MKRIASYQMLMETKNYDLRCRCCSYVQIKQSDLRKIIWGEIGGGRLCDRHSDICFQNIFDHHQTSWANFQSLSSNTRSSGRAIEFCCRNRGKPRILQAAFCGGVSKAKNRSHSRAAPINWPKMRLLVCSIGVVWIEISFRGLSMADSPRAIVCSSFD